MFREKFCFLRKIEVKPIEEAEDGVSRKMVLTDKNGASIEVVFKGSEKKDLLILGLKG